MVGSKERDLQMPKPSFLRFLFSLNKEEEEEKCREEGGEYIGNDDNKRGEERERQRMKRRDGVI